MPRNVALTITDFLSQKSVLMTILLASLMLVIFVADLQFTKDLYIGILYVVVIMLSMWLPGGSFTVVFAVASTTLAVLGYLFSIYEISPSSYLHLSGLVNLCMTLSVIWITAFVATYLKKMSMALTKSDLIYRAILNASIDPVFIVNKQGIIESVSTTVESCVGWEAKEIEGKKFVSLLAVEYRDKYEQVLVHNQNVADSPIIGKIREATALHRLRKEFPCEISISYLEIPEINESFFAVALRDISARKAYEERLGWMSSHDELTKISNRQYFHEALSSEWLRMLRSRESLALIIVDVDFFKNYNDALGSEAGDECLQKIGACIADNVRRAGDVVARYGGEEFTILLPATDQDGASDVANQIREAVLELNIAHPNSPTSKKVTVSIGVYAMVPLMGCTYERLLRFAGQALYEAKHTGRNKVCVHHE